MYFKHSNMLFMCHCHFNFNYMTVLMMSVNSRQLTAMNPSDDSSQFNYNELYDV